MDSFTAIHYREGVMLAPNLLQEAPIQYKTPINPETAAALAKKSHAARKTKSARRLSASSALTELDYHQFIKTYGVRIQFMLHRCSILFDKSRSGTEAERVASAIAKLFDVWADITQTPRRGVLRPEKMKKLLRDYGMKSALDKMLAQPSIEQPIVPPTEAPPIAPQQPPVETPPNQPAQPIAEPDSTQVNDDEDQPEPTADDFTKQNEDSLISPAKTVPTGGTRETENEGERR